MITKSPQNIIDSVYRISCKLKYNILLNMRASIFRSQLQNMESIFCVLSDNKNLDHVCSELNINAIIGSDYIAHSQYRTVYSNYHIKDIIILTDPPHKMLKKEDMILLQERLRETKKICIGSEISNSWPSNFTDIISIEPGLIKKEFNFTNKRKNLVILLDHNPTSHRIVSALSQQYKDITTINNYSDYDGIQKSLSEHRVCLNLNTSIDSIFGLQSGCVTISRDRYLEQVYKYDNFDSMTQLIDGAITTFDIKKQKDISLQISETFPYAIFEQKIIKTIEDTVKEPYII